MRISQSGDETGSNSKDQKGTFGGAMQRESGVGGKSAQGRSVAGGEFAFASGDAFSSGGLEAPDGHTRDPFPPSLVAYIEILRSVAAFLRQGRTEAAAAVGGVISGKVDRHIDEVDVDEPTTFAIGEEESSDCGGGDSPTLAVGEEDGGSSTPVHETTLAIGEDDTGNGNGF